MYSVYATTAQTLRAKWSFSYTHLSLWNDRVENCRGDCFSCSQSSFHGLPINPRFLYGYCLRQSTLIHWEPSRSFLLRLALRDRLFERGRRGRTRVSCRDSDGSFREVMDLLAEAEESCREEGFVELGFSGRNLKKDDVVNKSNDGEIRQCSRREGVRGGVRKNGSSLVYHSGKSSLSSDLEYNGVGGRRVVGESSRGYLKNGYGFDRVDAEEKEVREVRKYEDVGRNSRKELGFQESDGNVRAVLSSRKGFDRRIRDGEEIVDSWMNSAREASEEYVHEDHQVVGKRELREGSRQLTRSSEVGEYDTQRASSSSIVSDVRKADREESSASSARQHSNIDQRVVGRAEDRKGSQHGTNFERTSNSQRHFEEERVKGREDRSTSIHNLVQETRDKRTQMERQAVDKMDHRVVGRVDSRHSEIPEIHSGNVERTSNSQRHFKEEREKGREDRSTSAQNLVQMTRNKRTQMDQQSVDKMDQQVVGRVDSRTSSQRHSEISEIHHGNVERASNSQRHFEEERVKGREDRSTSVQNLVQIRNKRTEMDRQAVDKMETNKQYETRTNVSMICASDTEKVSCSKSSLDIRTDDREDHVNQVRGAREQQNQTKELVSHPDSLRMESERNIKRVSSSQEISNTRIKNQKETSLSVLVRDKNEKQRSTLIGESSQSTQTQMDFSGSLDGGQLYQVRNDAIESASRLDKSSALYVGEFVDKLRQEISTLGELDNAFRHSSEIEMGETQSGTIQATTSVETSVPEVTTRNRDEISVEEGGRQSASMSGMKGPSDEMWDVRGGLSSQEPSKTEEPEEDSSIVAVADSSTTPGTNENAVSRRSHRSLWTYVADIIRVGWGHRAGSHTSTLKSGTRSSSNESVSSEAWFSGNEPDDNDDEIEKKGSKGSTKESVQLERPVDQSHLGLSTSMGTMKRSSPPKGVPLISGAEEELSEGENGRQGKLSSVVTVDQSSASAGGTTSASVSEIENVPGSGLPKLEELSREKLTEVGGTEGKDGELKRRKLQRNKQVLKEQFEEWEDAYKLESEQRKMDEFFMREALLEAKKAADTWEVPVGAVLVQNGKIIARGCNLVEELRDSTAHAEMICIREASNLLRTWRLSETTLYVTLEPCAMCAGAILQARIDTVVWGAPNKLLGADGSWVRLFPGGDGGNSSLDPSNQMAGPVHPFHPRIAIRRGILATECSDVMQQFFQLRRKNNKKPEQPISAHPTKLFTKMHDIFCMMFCL